jgi:hypothetical protein
MSRLYHPQTPKVPWVVSAGAGLLCSKAACSGMSENAEYGIFHLSFLLSNNVKEGMRKDSI